MRRYVVYTRVSTEDQGKSGFGLEAQERDISIFLEKFSDVPFEVIGRFQDVQSGAYADRPELTKALALVRKTGAELLVAKLDRLSRKVSFIATLMDDPKVKLRVAHMPQARARPQRGAAQALQHAQRTITMLAPISLPIH